MWDIIDRRRLILISRLSILALATFCSSPELMHAQEPTLPVHTPEICTGELHYRDEDEPVYGYLPGPAPCPHNHVLFGLIATGKPTKGEPGTVNVYGYCCPLPANDILSDTTSLVLEHCPEDHVAIGSQQDCSDCDIQLICRKINTARYRLSKPSPGIHWGLTSAPWRQPKSIFKNDIPAGVRLGVTRVDRFSSAIGGCLGSPVGSILTGKSFKYCHDLSYKRLLFRGLVGDPPDGTAVTMFPDCTTVINVFSGKEECVE